MTSPTTRQAGGHRLDKLRAYPSFMRRIFPLFFAVALAVTPVLAQDSDEPDNDSALDDVPHITMTGTAQAEVTPDIATITIGVTAEQPTAAAASDDVGRRAKAIIDAAKAQGVAAADIATQSVTLSQTFDELRDPQGRDIGRRPRGFAAENIVAVRVRDLGKVGSLAGQLVESGANRLDGITFSVEHPEPIQTKLLAEAVKDARLQAQTAAEAAGVHLGRVLLITRPGGGATPMAQASRVRLKAASPMPIEAGTTTIGNEVEVTWALGGN